MRDYSQQKRKEKKVNRKNESTEQKERIEGKACEAILTRRKAERKNTEVRRDAFKRHWMTHIVIFFNAKKRIKAQRREEKQKRKYFK